MRQLLWIAFLALVLSACLQTAPAATPSPTATLQATVVPPATALPTPSPSATLVPSPTNSPAATPVASVSAVPTLAEAALRLEPILNDVFNISRTYKHQDTTFAQVEPDVWTMGDVQGDYLYTVTLSNARTRWRPEELLQTATSASGVQNGFTSYSVGGSDKANIMKCYGQRYEFNLNLKSYSRAWSAEDYQPLMRRLMGRLVDACPP